MGLALSQLLIAFILIPSTMNWDRVRKIYMNYLRGCLVKGSQKSSYKEKGMEEIVSETKCQDISKQTRRSDQVSIKSANLAIVEKNHNVVGLQGTGMSKSMKCRGFKTMQKSLNPGQVCHAP